MPTPQKYVSKSGAITWRVRFRDAGTGASETFHTKKQANDFIKLVAAMGGTRARAIMNEVEASDVMRHTVAEVADLWFAWKSARRSDGTPKHVGAPYTLTRYEQLIRLQIKPHLGDKPINLVSTTDIQEWVDLLHDDLAAKTVNDAHAILHTIFKWANHSAQGLAIVDPCTETDLPAKTKNRAKGLRPDEWQILYTAAKQVDADAADMLLFLVSSGWRWSEAVAIRAMDVDDYGTDGLWVNMGRVIRRDGNTFSFVNDAKTEAGIRRIKMSAEAAAMIRRRRAGLDPETLVFTNAHGRAWGYAGFHSRYWTASTLSTDTERTRKRILTVAQEMGLERAPELELHMLRHTHAVLMLLSGESMAAVQKRLGHEDINTTVGTYGSLVGDVSDSALDMLDAVLGGRQHVSGLRLDAQSAKAADAAAVEEAD